MGRAAKATRGGNKRRINPGRLAKKFQRHGLSERAAGVAARAAAKMSLSAPKERIATLNNLPPKMAKHAVAAVERAAEGNMEKNKGNNSSSGDDASSMRQHQQQQQQQQAPVKGVKAQIQSALAQLNQQRSLQEQRTVVKQAMRRNKK